jgi:hypothetical protein
MSDDKLSAYRAKRDFTKTPEPEGGPASPKLRQVKTEKPSRKVVRKPTPRRPGNPA